MFKAVRSGIEHGEPNEPPRGPKEEHHHRLQTALVEAQHLAYFATRNGISIEPDDLEIVTTSAESCAELESDPNKEKAFWMAFQRLAAAVHPVTTESIQAAPQAKKAVAIYAVCTIVILLLLVALQIYWLIGANLVAEIGDLRVQMAEHRTNIVAGHARENELDELIESESKEVARLEQKKLLSSLDSKDDLSSEDDVRSLKTLLSEKRSTLHEIRKDTEIESLAIREIKKEINSKLYLLDSWIFIPRAQIEPGKNGENYNSVHDIHHEGEYFEVIEFTSQILLAAAESIIKSMSSYVFPLIYGLLGALAYILRTLSRELREMTYSEESRIRYRLRWPLGMLAGIAVGWFFDPSDQSLPGLENLQPLALAFLAGYSVELLFTGLDRFVAAFSDKTASIQR